MEHLTAAFSLRSTNSNLSCQEFQEMLNSWFQKKGVLTELRLHLRFKLVSLLKDTTIGQNIGQGSQQTTSLLNQAVNLIVAEYLIQSKCFYSLSVFSTEATFIHWFPEYSDINQEVKGSRVKNMHFDRENIIQIMEIIGLGRSSLLCNKVLKQYFNERENKSLLQCLISLLSEYSIVDAQMNDKLMSLDSSDETIFLQDFEKLLISANLPILYVKKICESIKTFYGTKERLQKNEFAELLNQLKSEITSKERKIKELGKSKNILQNHLLKVNRSYQKTKTQLTELLHKENMSKENILQEINIDNTDDRNHKLHEDSCKPHVSLATSTERLCVLPHCTQVCRDNIKLMDDLANENRFLKEENNHQKDLIKKCFIIYKDLLNKFNKCQNELVIQSSRVNEGFSEDIFNTLLYEENVSAEDQFQKNVDENNGSSDSVTEEILQQARVKLQKLESETNEIEDKFKYLHYS